MADDIRIATLPGFPPDYLPEWTLSKLRDRVIMIAQFNCGRYTFSEAVYEAFNPITVSPEVRELCWDDEERAYADERNQRAAAARDATLIPLARFMNKSSRRTVA